jgi:ribosomal protein L14E/L6E/L27E
MSNTTKTVKIGGAKNGQTRNIVVPKTPKAYVLAEAKRPMKSRKVSRSTKLRESITPGTVLVLLAGRFRGKRVVFLKQLESGLLLVTGPYKTNGVPLKRVNQAFVIATSTKLDISSVKLNEKLNDSLFKKEKSAKAEFLAEKTEVKDDLILNLVLNLFSPRKSVLPARPFRLRLITKSLLWSRRLLSSSLTLALTSLSRRDNTLIK